MRCSGIVMVDNALKLFNIEDFLIAIAHENDLLQILYTTIDVTRFNV